MHQSVVVDYFACNIHISFSLFWGHLGQLSLHKRAPQNTRFWACFWGTRFGGSPQSLAGHPQAFYEGSQRPLGLRSCGGLVWLYVASRLLFAIISAHIGISLHISALVCIHQHQSALIGISLHQPAKVLKITTVYFNKHIYQ